MKNHNKNWYVIDNEDDVFSPSLLVYPDRIEKNIHNMITIAGSAERLRPHVKTHKMPEIIRLQMNRGIRKFKCATIAEAEMTASCGASDITLAYQPVGPNIERFFRLKEYFPEIQFSCIADTEEVIKVLSKVASGKNSMTNIWLDINNGMNRTGIQPGEKAMELFRLIDDLPMIQAIGLHVYDGHINDPDYSMRKKICDESFTPATELLQELEKTVNRPLKIIAGGSPTFHLHAQRDNVELSPGTTLLWDYRSNSTFSDMDYLHSGILFTRVISKPVKNTICLDLGHKAIASEMPQPRAVFPDIEDAVIINHNEEHMVVKTEKADMLNIGDAVYAIPWHICPTVDRFEKVTVVNDRKATGQWTVEGRRRAITI
jgi:D-serine deaminase-like pyridoxal phosphate-dependent protein